ncbi:ABC transporter ATP-binding protein [Streptomyces sp. NPDC097107]|uniref:ABC transporter ATP-binding protein n=1 Tax=Streptomyces sp. NPDC097107 TaxID=3366089 RepID=UPI0037F9C03C
MAEPSGRAPAVLQVTGLDYRVSPEFALRDISFEVAAGEGVAVIGSNGAGKTTVIRLVAGLLKPRAGTVTVCGTDARRWGRVSHHIGYVQQAKELPDGVTVEEYVRYQLRLRRAAPGRLPELLALAELEEYAGHDVRTLSGGSQRKLHLITAVAHRPDLLILDEPTAGLDPGAQQALLRLLADLKKDGVGVLFASHHRHELDALADSVVVLHAGRRTAATTLADIARTAGNPRLVLETHPDDQPGPLQEWAAALPDRHTGVRAVSPTPAGADVELTAGEHPRALGELVGLAHAAGIALRAASYHQATLADVVRTLSRHTGSETSP